MTISIDKLEAALEAADQELAEFRPKCRSCGSTSCRERPPRQSLLDLFWQAFGGRFDREGLRLDASTAAILIAPNFPRFERGATSQTDHDSDVLSEIANLGLTDAEEAAAIAWHMAAGRPDRDELADAAAARWTELQQIAEGLNDGC